MPIADLINRIVASPAELHGAGMVSARALRAIASHASVIGQIHHSVETGAGRTTLLFSHLSADHRVFAIDMARSISGVRQSVLFNAGSVTFIEGPTQVTMQQHVFPEKIQIALIDGPHGYPFPDLEYFRLYPLIETGGILLVDDIMIPSIRNMFEVIKADAMFELLEIVDQNLAIFKRTNAPLIDPNSDSWWLQGFNRSHYEKMQRGTMQRRLVDGASALVPVSIKDAIPVGLKTWLWKKRSS